MEVGTHALPLKVGLVAMVGVDTIRTVPAQVHASPELHVGPSEVDSGVPLAARRFRLSDETRSASAADVQREASISMIAAGVLRSSRLPSRPKCGPHTVWYSP